MLNKADATRLRLLVAIKSRALTLVSASGASVVDILLMRTRTPWRSDESLTHTFVAEPGFLGYF